MLMFFTQASIPRIRVKCVIVLGSVLHGDFQNSFPNFLELLLLREGLGKQVKMYLVRLMLVAPGES